MKKFLPIAEWSGRLILPQRSERRIDGGVWIELENVPVDSGLNSGRRVWLSWSATAPGFAAYRRATTDIMFDWHTFESISRGNVHPDRVDCWSNVSPLETLAGSRPDDDMRVMLKDVTVCFDGNVPRLETGREPVQICGTHVALVRFECMVDDKPLRYRVSHYDRVRKDFCGESDIIAATEISVPDGMRHSRTSLIGIETREHNTDGWYVYGEFRGGEFVARGLEPRALTGLDGACERKQVDGIDPGHDSNLPRAGVVRKTMIQTQGRDYSPVIGDSLLVLHVFGWRGGELGTRFTEGDRVDGHFATGRADVIYDPFTGQQKLDIEYTQLYCHNVEGIVSGCMKWHNYMGSLDRGWMYSVPVYDLLLHLPDLAESHDSRQVLDTLFAEIETMSFRMRSGDGNGLAPVNAAWSCAQETALAWWLACGHLLQSGLSARTGNVLKMVRRFFAPFGLVPPRWRRYAQGQPLNPSRKYSFVNIQALLTWHSVLPLVAWRGLARRLLKESCGAYQLHSAMAGGVIEGIVPVAPTLHYRQSQQQAYGVNSRAGLSSFAPRQEQA